MKTNNSSSALNDTLNNLTEIQTKLTDFEKSNFTASAGIRMLETLDVRVKNKVEGDGLLKTVMLIRFVNMLLHEPMDKDVDRRVKIIFKAALIKIEEANAEILLQTSKISNKMYTQQMNLLKENALKLIQNMTDMLEMERALNNNTQLIGNSLQMNNGTQDGNKNSLNVIDPLEIQRNRLINNIHSKKHHQKQEKPRW